MMKMDWQMMKGDRIFEINGVSSPALQHSNTFEQK